MNSEKRKESVDEEPSVAGVPRLVYAPATTLSKGDVHAALAPRIGDPTGDIADACAEF